MLAWFNSISWIVCKDLISINVLSEDFKDYLFHSLFRFPNQSVKKDSWIANLQISDFHPPSCGYICSNHFDSEDIVHRAKRTRVRHNALPLPFKNPSTSLLEIQSNNPVEVIQDSKHVKDSDKVPDATISSYMFPPTFSNSENLELLQKFEEFLADTPRKINLKRKLNKE